MEHSHRQPALKKLTEAAAAAYGDEKEYRRLKQSTLPYVTPAELSVTAGATGCWLLRD